MTILRVQEGAYVRTLTVPATPTSLRQWQQQHPSSVILSATPERTQ